MWQIENRTPFAAGQCWVRDRVGAETWLVVVKATFDVLRDGSTAVAKSQPAVTYAPVYRGTPGQSSLVADNDFVLAKKTTDVVVHGTAYAKGGTPVRSMEVGLQVGPVKKILKVFGERAWGPRGAWLSPPVPFTSMSITYERAFGGVDERSEHRDRDWYWPNPVGTGFVKSRARIEGVLAPNIEYPHHLIESWDSQPPPAGIGIISSHWHERAALSGTYDSVWAEKHQPLLPVDFNIAHFQTVPKDQQAPSFLRGGEPVVLVGLTPSGVSHFTLPSMALNLVTHFMDGERRPHQAHLHTVIVQPDLARVSLVWHSALECHPKVHQLDKTRVELTTIPAGAAKDRAHGDGRDDDYVDDDDLVDGVDNLLDLV